MIEYKNIFQEKRQEQLKLLYEQYLQWEKEGIIIGKELNEIYALYCKLYTEPVMMLRFDMLHVIADLWYRNQWGSRKEY